MKGTTKQCLRHYAMALPNKRGLAAELRSSLARFAGVSLASVSRWIANSGPESPIGLHQIKVRLFLTELGYDPVEMTDLKGFQLQAALLLGYNVLTPEELAQALGWNDTSRVFAIARGKDGTSQPNRDILEQLGVVNPRLARSFLFHKSLDQV